MDPLTQGVVGAIAVQSIARREEQRLAAALGFVAGTLADLDVLIRSARDPLLFLEFHRQFSHSLAFLPVAATLLAALLWPVLGWIRRRADLPHLGFIRLWVWLAVAYGTHGLLDACTSYGTQLLWPFAESRVAWNLVAAVDPGLTVPALALALLAWRRRSSGLGRFALVWVLIWLGLGLMQRERAEVLLIEIAADHGHFIERGSARPTMFNLILWRGVWQSDERIYAAALRPGWFGPDRSSAITSAPVFRRDRELPNLDPATTAVQDIERFRVFSDGWLVALPRDDTGRLLVGDARYAILPDQIRPLWAIRIDPTDPQRPADYVTLRQIDPDTLARFRSMVLGDSLSTIRRSQ